MRRIRTWLRARLETFALLPEYGKATAKQWMNILFGETVLGVIFLIWWALANPKNPPLILIFVAAVIIAGYFVWRADHIRLISEVRSNRTSHPADRNRSEFDEPVSPDYSRVLE
jgi:predicted membrane metal-binding protein